MKSLGPLRGEKVRSILSSSLLLALILGGLQQVSAADRKTRFDFAPSITTQPANQTVVAGQSASFAIAVTGTAPIAYQWTKNGSAIRGATSSTYKTPPAKTTDTGSKFVVVVRNAAGRVTSAAATLMVTAPKIVVSSVPPPPVDANGTGTATSGTTTGTTSGTTTGSTGNTSTSTPTGTATLVFTGQLEHRALHLRAAIPLLPRSPIPARPAPVSRMSASPARASASAECRRERLWPPRKALH